MAGDQELAKLLGGKLLKDLETTRDASTGEQLEELRASGKLAKARVLRLGLHTEHLFTAVDAWLEGLSGSPDLHELYIWGAVTDTGIIHLNSRMLTFLHLEGTEITDTGLEALPVTLRTLILVGNKNITEPGVTRLQERLPRCQITLR